MMTANCYYVFVLLYGLAPAVSALTSTQEETNTTSSSNTINFPPEPGNNTVYNIISSKLYF